jgi:hypothetical protein
VVIDDCQDMMAKLRSEVIAALCGNVADPEVPDTATNILKANWLPAEAMGSATPSHGRISANHAIRTRLVLPFVGLPSARSRLRHAVCQRSQHHPTLSHSRMSRVSQNALVKAEL